MRIARQCPVIRKKTGGCAIFRILIAECKQEIPSFNPIICQYDQFAILEYHKGVETEVCGVLEVFRQRDDIELVPAYSANQKGLAHTVCQQPIYPLDEGVTFTPAVVREIPASFAREDRSLSS